MKAARVPRFGPPNVITNDDLPRPDPAAGQLLVRVKAAGVGNWDALIREGKIQLQTLPLIPGSELAGIVEAIGAEVSGFKLSDEVYGATNEQFSGAYAEYAVPFGQNDGAKTEDPELHRGGLGSSCNCHGLADALRLCPCNYRADRAHPRSRGQRWRVRHTTGQAGWSSYWRDAQCDRSGIGRSSLELERAALGTQTLADACFLQARLNISSPGNYSLVHLLGLFSGRSVGLFDLHDDQRDVIMLRALALPL